MDELEDRDKEDDEGDNDDLLEMPVAHEPSAVVLPDDYQDKSSQGFFPWYAAVILPAFLRFVQESFLIPL
jgi:hypothetical protein